jgi:hypothetical protein
MYSPTCARAKPAAPFLARTYPEKGASMRFVVVAAACLVIYRIIKEELTLHFQES